MATKPIFKDTDQGPVIRRKLNEMSDYFDDVTQEVGEITEDVILAKRYRDEAEVFKNTSSIKAGEAATSATDALESKNAASQSANDADQSAIEAEQHAEDAQAAAAEAHLVVGDAQTSIFMQRQIFTTDTIIPTGYNALIIGEFSVQTGVTIEGQGTATLRGL